MARVRTGYSGRDMRGRPTGPLSRDIGAASAATDGLAALGRLSATKLDPYLHGDAAHAAGAGPVERRQETPEERAAREARDQAAAMRGLRIAVARAPKSSTARTAIAAPAAVPVNHEEETVTVIATIEPAEALPAIPCASCVHTAVCRIQPMVEQAMYAVAQLGNAGDPAVRIRSTVECDHHLVAEPAHIVSTDPTPTRHATAQEMQASRLRGGEANRQRLAAAPASSKGRHTSSPTERREKAERAARVLEALERHSGDRRAAAASIGMRGTAFATVLKYAQRLASEPQAVAS